ncbi:hypothetical protein PLICBS_003870 [Purpureocillium lilacinum]|uniref:uncharacterized protein n=1 Tax=Purpureocillium lilacinum TaxID=33203 RepID=UPI002084DCB2|nr:hypothetical protein PLICBS_003870 [Purpureocillium lilacinum]
MFMPVFKSYRGYFVPVNWIFSYLWITSFIFSTEGWSGRICAQTPLGTGRCSQKRTVEAFNFLAFWFLLCNVVVEGFLWHATRDDTYMTPSPVVKERPATGNTEGSAAAPVEQDPPGSLA